MKAQNNDKGEQANFTMRDITQALYQGQLDTTISRLLGPRGEEDTPIQHQYRNPKNNAISRMFRPLR